MSCLGRTGGMIGGALGRSDRLQTRIDTSEANLANRLTVLGVDPESSRGLGIQKGEQQASLFRLTQRRAELQKALSLNPNDADIMAELATPG